MTLPAIFWIGLFTILLTVALGGFAISTLNEADRDRAEWRQRVLEEAYRRNEEWDRAHDSYMDLERKISA